MLAASLEEHVGRLNTARSQMSHADVARGNMLLLLLVLLVLLPLRS